MQGRVIKERYRLEELLGHGGMGSVWRARDLTLQIDVAVKLIDPNFAESGEARARFEREALAAAQLRSMNIVLITDHGVDGDTPFIVMELLRGESLASRLQKRAVLSFGETLTVFSQIADALALAHERKIVHRDLKPDNVFIVSERTRELVKVLDFGVAKKLDAQSFGNKIKTHTGMLLGTPYYMSPEQTRGSATIDHRSDVWSFGVMVYECVTGKRPFEADTLPDLLMAICRDPFAPPSMVAMVPRGFDEWFAQTAERDVNQRFQSIEAAANALGVLSGASLVGTRVPMPSGQRTDAETVYVTPPAPTVSSATGVDGASAMEPNTVMPSSVTSPGIVSAKTNRRSLGWLLSGLLAAGAMVVYWLWPTSIHISAEREPAVSAQHGDSASPVLTPTATDAAAALASSPAALSSVESKPAVLPVGPAPNASKTAIPKPRELAPARPVVRPTVPGPRPSPNQARPFSGGF